MSEIRVNKITNRSGLGTVTVSDAGAIFSGEKTGFGTDNPRYTLEVGAVGAGGTQLWVNGDARVTGIMSIGQGTITLDPDSNMIKLGALTMHRDSSTGDAILMNTGGTYNPFRASKFLIDATEVIDNNRNFTGVDANFSGNVSVGGTLTYEDVTNIDSVGIVTAQAGIHVTGGDVSIGHNNPSHKLDVVGNTQLYGTLAIGDNTDISPTANGAGQLHIDGNGYTPYIAADGTAMYVGHNSSARDLRLQTNETDRLTIDGSTGNVGIGTDNPNTELEVFSDTFSDITINSARTSGNIGGINFRKGGVASGIMTAQFIVDTGGAYHFYSQGTERLRIASNGELISTNGTLRRDVETSSFAVSGGTASNAGANINLYGASHSSLANVFRVRTGATERLRIDSAGDVYIGKTTNNYTSSGRTVLALAGSSNALMEMGHGTTTDGFFYAANDEFRMSSVGALPLIFHTDSTERVRITSGGSVNIGGDYTQTGYKAQITGDLLIQKNQAAYQHPQIELYNYNTGGYGGAIKFTGNLAGTKYTQGTIRTYGGSNTSDGSLAFFTGDGTEKLRITSAGNVSIEDGNLVVASGHGIDFSATSGPAGMQSEILDDYEEGTFTPILSQGYTGISHGTGYPVGDYVKVGQLCHVSISFYFSSTGYQSTTRVRIEGLPFAGNSTAVSFAGFLTYGFGNISLNNYNSLGWYIANNQTYADQYAMNGPTGYNTYPNANASNRWIQISGTYRVD